MKERQAGAVLVMVAILIVVLIGVAALALDVGRLLVLKTEMQNAVDAAALAAAAELDGQSQASSRAETAAKTLITTDSHFAKVQQLLGSTLTNDEIKFTFFCGIENDVAKDPSNITSECPGGQLGDGSKDTEKYTVQGDTDAHYVRVTLNPVVTQGADESRYSIELYFLPILSTLGINVPSEASTTATALAGRSNMICRYPPLMICNPYEGASGSLSVGQQIRLYMGATNGSWVPGDFGLLVPPDDKSGAADIGHFLAGAGVSCSEPYISTAPGGKVNQIKWGLNTRFGIYGQKYSQKDYLPAANVLDYPRDSNLIADPNERIGNGVWKPVSGYWNDYKHTTGSDPGFSTRYEYYSWEIEHDDIPHMNTKPANTCDPITTDKKCTSGSVIWDGVVKPTSTTVDTDLNRRVVTVPVLNCTALSIKGSTPDIWVTKKDYWKKFFLTEHVDDPSGSPIIYGEYLGNVDEAEGTYRVEVKLYE